MIQAVSISPRRQELAAFLRARRNAIHPAHVGIWEDDGRHCSGLRREEVASLAGISTTWYTWLEQGRDINVSDDVIQKIGAALQLSPTELDFVRLSASDEPAIEHTLKPAIPNVLRALVESHSAAPAYIATPRFDLVVWNAFMGDIFHYSSEGSALARNILWRLFFDPSRRKLYVDWEEAARGTVAAFRYMRARYIGDEHFETLLGRMLRSADFARIWARNEVAAPGLRPFLVRDDALGVCELTTVQASLGIAPGCYLALFAARRLS